MLVQETQFSNERRFPRNLDNVLNLVFAVAFTLTIEYGEINKLMNLYFEEVTTWLGPRVIEEDRMDIS
jgi:hypothetical protein